MTAHSERQSTTPASFEAALRLEDEGRHDEAFAMFRYYAAYRQMMDHWSFTLMGRVVPVEHEAIVANPETEIRKLLQRCGLTWNDQCLRFHENPRTVKTLSAEQVRRPIFNDGVGRWRRYERHLGPLLEALGPYAPRRG